MKDSLKEKLNSITVEIQEQNVILEGENEKFMNGNKSAGTRARAAALAIGKLTKSYRQAVSDLKNNM